MNLDEMNSNYLEGNFQYEYRSEKGMFLGVSILAERKVNHTCFTVVWN